MRNRPAPALRSAVPAMMVSALLVAALMPSKVDADTAAASAAAEEALSVAAIAVAADITAALMAETQHLIVTEHLDLQELPMQTDADIASVLGSPSALLSVVVRTLSHTVPL